MASRQTSCPACARPRSHDGDAGPCSARAAVARPAGRLRRRRGQPHRLVRAGARLRLAPPGRLVHVAADAAYYGPALSTLPENVTWTCRIPYNAVPYSLVRPAPASAVGPAPRETGPARSDDIAAAAAWARATVTAYGRRENLHVAEVTCLWYGSWHTRTVRLILSRDERTAGGYDLALITADLAASPVALVARYAAPWASSRRSPTPATSWRRRGPQPRPARRRAHCPVRSARAHPDRHLVCTVRPRPMSATAAPPGPGTGPRPSRPLRTCSSSWAAR